MTTAPYFLPTNPAPQPVLPALMPVEWPETQPAVYDLSESSDA